MFSRKRYSEEVEPSKNKWLQRLQQESWELELLVSGFSILLLFKAGEFLDKYTLQMDLYLNNSVISAAIANVFVNIVIMALGALIVNLTVHLLLRGFWVGIVGLGSVAPKTDIEKLNYTPYIAKRLKNKIGDLEKLVVFLDNISSLIFAFAFLVIFLLLAFALFFVFLFAVAGVAIFIEGLSIGIFSNIIEVITVIILGLYILFGLVYLIDFLSLGLIKKSKRLAKVYYPIYVFFGWITLAFMYRIIYYNLISRFSKKRIAIILGSYLILMTIIPSLYMDHTLYFSGSDYNYYIQMNYYSDQRPADDVIDQVDIPSRIISTSHLPVFIRYNVNDNDKLKARFSDFEPSKQEKLLSSIYISFKNGINIHYGNKLTEKDPEGALQCLSEFYKVYINDSLLQPKFYFTTHQNNNERGLYTVLDINNLQRGEHLLVVRKEYLNKDSVLTEMPFARVPFWKE